jgi:DNA-binding Lrp family transcriptional regulator
MTTPSLTPRQRLVLRVAEFYYNEGIEKIAKVAGLKPHAVRYDLRDLTERKVITPSLFFNEACFGYYIFHLHLSTHVQNVAVLSKAFMNNSKVAYLGRLGGKRALGVTILSKRPEDLFETVDLVGKQAKVPFAQVGWCIEGDFFHYGASCILPDKKMPFESEQSWKGARVEIDQVDARLIQIIKRQRITGNAEIARAAGLPSSTVQYRLRRLSDAGATLNRSLLINYSALGFSVFEILLRCSGQPAEATKIVRRFCKEHPAAELLIRCFGDWDFKVLVQARDVGEVLEFEEQLQRSLGAHLEGSIIVPVRGPLKRGDFPADDFNE